MKAMKTIEFSYIINIFIVVIIIILFSSTIIIMPMVRY